MEKKFVVAQLAFSFIVTVFVALVALRGNWSPGPQSRSSTGPLPIECTDGSLDPACWLGRVGPRGGEDGPRRDAGPTRPDEYPDPPVPPGAPTGPGSGDPPSVNDQPGGGTIYVDVVSFPRGRPTGGGPGGPSGNGSGEVQELTDADADRKANSAADCQKKALAKYRECDGHLFNDLVKCGQAWQRTAEILCEDFIPEIDPKQMTQEDYARNRKDDCFPRNATFEQCREDLATKKTERERYQCVRDLLHHGRYWDLINAKTPLLNERGLQQCKDPFTHQLGLVACCLNENEAHEKCNRDLETALSQCGTSIGGVPRGP